MAEGGNKISPDNRDPLEKVGLFGLNLGEAISGAAREKKGGKPDSKDSTWNIKDVWSLEGIWDIRGIWGKKHLWELGKTSTGGFELFKDTSVAGTIAGGLVGLLGAGGIVGAFVLTEKGKAWMWQNGKRQFKSVPGYLKGLGSAGLRAAA